MLQQVLNQTWVTKQTNSVEIPNPTASLAKQGNFHKCYLSKLLNMNGWIVDAGASNYMTDFLHGLIDYKQCDRVIKVTMANDTISYAKGEGSIYLTNLCLKSILYVPKLRCNLLSISKITKDMNCKVTFSPTHCVFQDLISEKMIDNAEEKEGLYYVKGAVGTPIFSKLHNSFLSSVVLDSRIQLWHKRLDHPSFRYLKILYSRLFVNKMSKFYNCEQCILAKQTKASHPIHSYQPTKPFYLIYSDVRGPTKILNLTKTR